MILNFVEYLFGVSRVVGMLLVAYGGMLALVPENGMLNAIGLFSYYIGSYQMCIADPIDFDEEVCTK